MTNVLGHLRFTIPKDSFEPPSPFKEAAGALFGKQQPHVGGKGRKTRPLNPEQNHL